MNAVDKIFQWAGNRKPEEAYQPILRFKRLHQDAKMPQKAHLSDAGYDLWCIDAEIDHVHRTLTCHTGIAIDIPKGYVGLLFSRSSIWEKDLLQNNAVGVIDAGYKGDITFKFRIFDSGTFLYKPGDKVGQIVFLPLAHISGMMEVEDIGDSERGANGFGSTGK